MAHGLPPLRWYLAHGVELTFSTAQDGDLRNSAQRQTWLKRIGRPGECRFPRQIHGTAIVDATDAAGLLTADGVIHAHGDVAVFGADCPGLCIATPHQIGMAHCGWRGTAAGIVPRLIEALSAATTDARSSWHAFIGPGISAPYYEVDAPVLAARSWPPSSLAPHGPDHAFLDLAAAITWDLKHAGVGHVQRSDICTHIDKRLHSYRWQGPGPTQLLLAWRRGDSAHGA